MLNHSHEQQHSNFIPVNNNMSGNDGLLALCATPLLLLVLCVPSFPLTLYAVLFVGTRTAQVPHM